MRCFSRLFLFLFIGTALSLQSQAQSYPRQPIQLISPFAPGSTDMMLRPFAEKMAEFIGQPLIISYKPGAGGTVGAAFVANSKPDGYTLVGTSIGSIVLGPLASKEVKFNLDSFVPVAAVAEGSLILVVPSSSPHKTLKDLID